MKKEISGTKAEDIFYTLNTPVFLLPNAFSSTIILNPCLKTLGFQYVISPLVAFQEISMFLGSLKSVKENKEYVVGDDKVLACSKGMDPTTSFHQINPTKKEKRKLNKITKKSIHD